jgi:signal transduction histidine kinase
MDPTLAALVVHDLKNALGGLEHRLAVLAAARGDADLAVAHAQCEALRRRFIGFLTVYGADRPGGLVAHAEDASPGDLLHALARVPAGWERTGPSPVLEVDDALAPPYAFFDERLVRLALEAALHNAWRFARSRIVIRARAMAQGLWFEIDDDGPGPQGGAVDPDAGHATGLGTALVQAVATAHRHEGRQGWSRLEALPEGGSRFTLGLP